jgi:hypothetical protein
MPLELSPIQKDIARYIPHLAFAMLAFPCWFVMRAAEIPSLPHTMFLAYFADIKRVAETFREMAADEFHCAALYGKAILKELARIEMVFKHKATRPPADTTYDQTNPQMRDAHGASQQHSTATDYEQLPNGLGNSDSMNFSGQPLNTLSWQGFEGGLSSPGQLGSFGEIEGWFLNNFWDP